MKKKLGYLFAVVTLLFTMLGSLTSVAAQIVTTAPDNTTVHVTKVIWDSDTFPTNYPTSSDGNPIDSFDDNATYLNGAVFEYWEVTAAEYQTLMTQLKDTNATDQYLVKPTKAATGTIVTGETYSNGKGHASISLGKGYYWFAEVEGSGITDYLATSFGVVLPFANVVDGVEAGYLTNLYVYPKNLSTVTVDKTVEDLETNDATYNIGDEITYYVEARIPAGNITAFTLTDKLSVGLEYIANSGQLYFSQTLLANPTALAGNGTAIGGTSPTFDVLATDAINLNDYKGGYVYIKYQARITADAAMGEDLNNKIELEIDRDGQTTKRTDDADVHTGGKKFIKRDRSTGAALKDAIFVVKNAAGQFYQYVEKTGTSPAKVNWVTDIADATRLKSGENGKFEIKGLAYGTKGEDAATGKTTYYLFEEEAPEKYVIPASLSLTGNGTAFEISASSYADAEKEIDLATNVGGTLVNNTAAPTIPNTGGIGAIVFILGGIGVIAVALIGIRKRLASK